MRYHHLKVFLKRLNKVGAAFSILLLIIAFTYNCSTAQHSIAKEWNEVLLEAIRNDFARPTVHARNLFHSSVAMYDAWAVFDDQAETYLLGKDVHGFSCDFDSFEAPGNIEDARIEAISYAMYRILKERFAFSPGTNRINTLTDSLFTS